MNQSRRAFLRTATASAAVAALPNFTRASANPSASPAESGPGIVPPPLVDWHSHIITSGEIEFLRGRSAAPRVRTDEAGKVVMENVTTASFATRGPSPIAVSDLETRVKHLDAAGVRRQLLTYTVANGYEATIPVEELRPFYRRLNDDLAAALRQFPGRFPGVAAVPTADPKWAATELKRAHRELGLIGAALPLNAFTTLEGARTLAPLFAAGQKLGSHFFIHRAPASAQIPGQPPVIVPGDLDAVRWSVISNTHLANGAITLGLTDFLDPFPDVTVQVIMLGGFLPYLIDSIVAAGPRINVKDPLARLRRLYLEPGPYAGSAGEWVALAARKLGADRILFGTDYGVGGGTSADRLAPSIATLNAALPEDARRQIYHDNTVTLLKAKGIA